MGPTCPAPFRMPPRPEGLPPRPALRTPPGAEHGHRGKEVSSPAHPLPDVAPPRCCPKNPRTPQLPPHPRAAGSGPALAVLAAAQNCPQDTAGQPLRAGFGGGRSSTTPGYPQSACRVERANRRLHRQGGSG